MVLGTALVAFVIVAVRRLWLPARNVITIVHEGGHALAALLTGRRLDGIKLHADTSGVTLSRGKPSGPGMVIMLFAGYVAPSLVGLGFTILLGVGRVTELLWASIVVLALMLIMVRNVYGVFSLVVTGVGVFLVSWYATPEWQGVFAYLATWFLLFGGVRPVFELQSKRSRRGAQQSDADQLARLTGLPGIAWVTLFLVVNLGSLATAATWLTPEAVGRLVGLFG
ncbi:M50 family peptidase [Pseudonocardiaceae bacterium YIM PH 21723]|nr:M50 family peptidase [Pseudonocardiaceae bacterium YIM PH 21723]